MAAFIFSMAWLLGLILAPATLALLGNLAGELQWLLPVALAAAVAIYCLNAHSLNRLTRATGEPGHALDALSDALGHVPAVTLYFGGRFVTTLAASTVMLVTAGFVFNETIVYWFPNFAFAFAVLGVVLVIHLLGQAAAQWFQLLAIALTITGIATLAVMGLAGTPPPAQDGGLEPAIALRSVMAVLLLFVGFDLAANHRYNGGAIGSRWLLVGLLAAAAVLAIWSVVSIQYVPARKLADSYIAHTLAAKAVAGQPGRLIMAVVIISGTCAAVNALIWNQACSISRLTSQWNGASPVVKWFRHRAAGSLMSGGIIAAMMATGVAGTNEIDAYVRAGLYFWMLYYAAVHLGTLRVQLKGGHGFSLPALLGLVLMAGASGALMATDPDRDVVLRAAIGIAIWLAMGWWTARAKQRSIGTALKTH